MRKNVTIYVLLALFGLSNFANAQYQKIWDFIGSTGANPYGNLTLSGSILYGMTDWGGANDSGVVFSIHTDGTGYKDLLDFNSQNGANPMGSLTLVGSVLYGMTSWGGGSITGWGNVFSIHTDGTEYKDLFDFSSTNGGITPWGVPYGSLTLSGSVLYGMTDWGGANDWGYIFSIHTDGSEYAPLHEFDGVHGLNPQGDLTLSGSVLYGMTSGGMTYTTNGNIFSIHTDGSDYTDLWEFNGTTGANPQGSLALLGSVLYGMTNGGGEHNDGVIFSIHTDGSGFKDLMNFNGTDGDEPYGSGSLTLLGSVLYGMTWSGGEPYNDGVIFSMRTDSSNYNVLMEFNGTNGEWPDGSLTVSGSLLYGMTFGTIGGPNYGNIFSYNLNNKAGVNEIGVGSRELGMKVYPNPATSYINIVNSQQSTDKYVLTIRNVEGQEVVKENVEFTNVYKLNLPNIANGIYFLSLQNDNENYVSKVVIQK